MTRLLQSLQQLPPGSLPRGATRRAGGAGGVRGGAREGVFGCQGRGRGGAGARGPRAAELERVRRERGRPRDGGRGCAHALSRAARGGRGGVSRPPSPRAAARCEGGGAFEARRARSARPPTRRPRGAEVCARQRARQEVRRGSRNARVRPAPRPPPRRARAVAHCVRELAGHALTPRARSPAPARANANGPRALARAPVRGGRQEVRAGGAQHCDQ